MHLRRYGTHFEVRTPAKLNLFLEVLGRRADGYHELETVMTTAGVYDSLCLAHAPSISLDCRWAAGLTARRQASLQAGRPTPWDALPPAENNLVVRALQRLRERAGVESGAAATLVKSIPAAAGLGGASSDAAAALIGANALWQLGWSRDRLADLAAELGSDIPFFVVANDGARHAALCRGRGERIELLPDVPLLSCVIVRPPAGLSTADVFRHCTPASAPESVEPLVRALRDGRLSAIGRALHNRLQPAAARLSPWIARLERLFDRLGFVGHAMSGSGSSYFGIACHARQARCLAGVVRQSGLGAVFGAAAPAI